jgi:hypothetical protein
MRLNELNDRVLRANMITKLKQLRDLTSTSSCYLSENANLDGTDIANLLRWINALESLLPKAGDATLELGRVMEFSNQLWKHVKGKK